MRFDILLANPGWFKTASCTIFPIKYNWLTLGKTMFVLIEQWRPSGEPPEPLWVRLLMLSAPQRRVVPWWYSYDDRNAHAIPPLSPLTQERRGANVHEVPMFVAPQMPRSGGW